uniref:Secreted protein n=1 Tax=Timema genevievae TaxID=629358 RepID=A0A7R9PM66_TIMGE|nr:unnamed protein product [Timema genevievae]
MHWRVTTTSMMLKFAGAFLSLSRVKRRRFWTYHNNWCRNVGLTTKRTEVGTRDGAQVKATTGGVSWKT